MMGLELAEAVKMTAAVNPENAWKSDHDFSAG
jgi:hypothetical protein